MDSHDDRIVDQFTRQATGFAAAQEITDEGALAFLIRATAATPEDLVLDLACGPGLVVCAFATHTRHATGIDLTPAMIEKAQELQRRKGLRNASWRVGDVLSLPFPDGAFSIVTCRLAFHHFRRPERVLAEMKRVCRRGGRIAVADLAASEDPEVAARLNAMDRLRDPSHVRFMPLAELRALFATVGLPEPAVSHYRSEGDMESFLSRSFPDPGNEIVIRRMFEASLGTDGLGLGTRREGDSIRYSYPVAVLVSEVGGVAD